MHIDLPDWVAAYTSTLPFILATPEDRMRVAIELSRLNVRHATGGPFGAAIVETETGRLLAVGVNQVVALRASVLHAEVVAVLRANQALDHHDLGHSPEHHYELYTSCEPCTMCLGATLWSGVRALYIAARDEDARAIGFDEGPKPTHWPDELEVRGLHVVRDLLRDEAVAVLNAYASAGHPIYNARQGSD
jgi:tRNA(Arg) A34 adenosine deaminase TadA